MFEFVKYTGEYPNLCGGKLTFKVNGRETTIPVYNWLLTTGRAGYNRSSGECYTEVGQGWDIDFVMLESELEHCSLHTIECEVRLDDNERRLFQAMINENIQPGCCGGCT